MVIYRKPSLNSFQKLLDTPRAWLYQGSSALLLLLNAQEGSAFQQPQFWDRKPPFRSTSSQLRHIAIPTPILLSNSSSAISLQAKGRWVQTSSFCFLFFLEQRTQTRKKKEIKKGNSTTSYIPFRNFDPKSWISTQQKDASFRKSARTNAKFLNGT